MGTSLRRLCYAAFCGVAPKHPMATDENHGKGSDRTLEALDAILRLREEYKDVIAVPEVVTIHDIVDYLVESPAGVKPFGELFDKKTAEFALNYFNGTDYITPESFENTLLNAVAAHKQQNNKK